MSLRAWCKSNNAGHLYRRIAYQVRKGLSWDEALEHCTSRRSYDGDVEHMTHQELADAVGLCRTVITRRLGRGWTKEEIARTGRLTSRQQWRSPEPDDDIEFVPKPKPVRRFGARF